MSATAAADLAPRQWPGVDSTELPSFYSPPNNAQHPSDDVEPVDLKTPRTDLSAPEELISAASTPLSLSSRSSSCTHVPPPSLLSPAFTPPATPGTLTPNPAEPSSLFSCLLPSSVRSEPRGVPVDSTIPMGGCGTKKPRLLTALPTVRCIVRARIPTRNGTEMFLHLYENDVDNKEHMAIVFGSHIRSRSLDKPREDETEWDRLVRGAYTGRLYPGRTTSGFSVGSDLDAQRPPKIENETAEGSESPRPQIGQQQQTTSTTTPLVRIHSECYTGETVWSARCDCGEQLDEAERLMSLPSNQRSGGIIIYLRQEGRGIGLGEKLKAYNLQDLGLDTVEANLRLRHPADARSYGLATAILRDLGQEEVRLLTNNPDKIRAVEGPDREIRVRERVAMVPLSWKGKGGLKGGEVDAYMRTKILKMGHLLSMDEMPAS